MMIYYLHMSNKCKPQITYDELTIESLLEDLNTLEEYSRYFIYDDSYIEKRKTLYKMISLVKKGKIKKVMKEGSLINE